MAEEVHEISSDPYNYLQKFLETDTYTRALLEVRADPQTIRIAAHVALDQVLDKVEPEWQANREKAMGQI